MSRNFLLIASAVAICANFLNISSAEEEGAQENEFYVALLKNQIKEEEEEKVAKLKTLLDNYQKGVVEEDKIYDLEAQILAGKNPAKLKFYVKGIHSKDYKEGATNFIVPVGYRLEDDPREGEFFRNCISVSNSRAEAEACAHAIEMQVDDDLNTAYESLKDICKDKGCDESLLEMQRSWNNYRVASYKFMDTYIGQNLQTTTGLQTNFWCEELIKQLKVLKDINTFMDAEK